MAECPYCGEPGADVLFSTVFCINPKCDWYDAAHAKKLQNTAGALIDEFVKSVRDSQESSNSTSSVPLPVWSNKDLGTD